jgi:hypothetical protein
VVLSCVVLSGLASGLLLVVLSGGAFWCSPVPVVLFMGLLSGRLDLAMLPHVQVVVFFLALCSALWSSS